MRPTILGAILLVTAVLSTARPGVAQEEIVEPGPAQRDLFGVEPDVAIQDTIRRLAKVSHRTVERPGPSPAETEEMENLLSLAKGDKTLILSQLLLLGTQSAYGEDNGEIGYVWLELCTSNYFSKEEIITACLPLLSARDPKMRRFTRETLDTASLSEVDADAARFDAFVPFLIDDQKDEYANTTELIRYLYMRDPGAAFRTIREIEGFDMGFGSPIEQSVREAMDFSSKVKEGAVAASDLQDCQENMRISAADEHWAGRLFAATLGRREDLRADDVTLLLVNDPHPLVQRMARVYGMEFVPDPQKRKSTDLEPLPDEVDEVLEP